MLHLHPHQSLALESRPESPASHAAASRIRVSERNIESASGEGPSRLHPIGPLPQPLQVVAKRAHRSSQTEAGSALGPSGGRGSNPRPQAWEAFTEAPKRPCLLGFRPKCAPVRVQRFQAIREGSGQRAANGARARGTARGVPSVWHDAQAWQHSLRVAVQG
jgi:hypothetical protein